MNYFNDAGEQVFPPSATNYVHTRGANVGSRMVRIPSGTAWTITVEPFHEVCFFDMTPEAIVSLGRSIMEQAQMLIPSPTGPADQEIFGEAGAPAQSVAQAELS